MKKSKKSGFTLVELMVVAAIIAILAAIIVPLLSSNKDSAIASEAANLCGAVATDCKVIWVRSDSWPTDVTDLSDELQTDIGNAKYVTDIDIAGSGPDDFTITATADYTGGDSLDLSLDETGTWAEDAAEFIN